MLVHTFGWEVTGKLHLLFFVCYLRRSLLCVAFSVAGQPGLLSPVCDFAGHRSSAAFFPSVTAAAAVRVDSDGNSSGENPSSPIRVGIWIMRASLEDGDT
ncbi:unnamed protein product [Cuscuta campestris]|uniref:Secreted protein n=1 Tax=Cuscuta campestris TaxID=132261 RepID=A0A484LLW5_9ASTE|nr:unnamed protein product [Cuscuta campestris]